jgi:RNA polymerase sigma-70 factor (ECF subfamily)
MCMVRAPEPMADSNSSIERTFDDFFLTEYAGLVRAMWLLTGNRSEGEDLAQEAMARACERWDKMSAVKNPAAYVYTMAFNLNRRRLRGVLRLRLTHFEGATAQDPASDIARRADLMRAIRQLSRKQREALLLVEWLDLSAEEAAQALDVEPTSIRVRLHRARNQLRQTLGGSYE